MVKKCAVSLITTTMLMSYAALSQDWPQWGGPNRNFTSTVTGLSATWGSALPKVLWTRNLGEGYSSVVVEENRAYTMYRVRSLLQFLRYDQEVVIALDAATGETLWEHRYDAPALPSMDLS